MADIVQCDRCNRQHVLRTDDAFTSPIPPGWVIARLFQEPKNKNDLHVQQKLCFCPSCVHFVERAFKVLCGKNFQLFANDEKVRRRARRRGN